MASTKKPSELATRRASKSGVVLQATPNEIAQAQSESQLKIPPRAILARRWPKLRVNRYSGKWLDEASGARGDSLASLVAYIGGEAR